MKKYFFKLIILAAFAFASCQQEEISAPINNISETEAAQIKALGFSTKDVIKEKDGFIVEGDIFLSKEDLNRKLGGEILRIGEAEQYRTTQLVTGLPRVIKVALSNTIPASFGAALDVAISRYNAENLSITFQRVEKKQDILFYKAPLGVGYLASAGFPTAQGYVYPLILVNADALAIASPNTIASVFAHEIGHCIGFRHTDFMNRAFSCGGPASNEGAGDIGAIHIPGTPTGPDAGSWMLSCIGRNTNRPFNANDKIALAYLY